MADEEKLKELGSQAVGEGYSLKNDISLMQDGLISGKLPNGRISDYIKHRDAFEQGLVELAQAAGNRELVRKLRGQSDQLSRVKNSPDPKTGYEASIP